MRCNHGSPWIQEMGDRTRFPALDGDLVTDVAVVGAGIAGMSTAFHILEGSGLRVTVLEKDRVGHGASGRNAGQGIAVLERSLEGMVKDLGGERLASLLTGMESGHAILRDVCRHIGYEPAPVGTEAWSGLSGPSEVEAALSELELRQRIGAPLRQLVIAQEASPEFKVSGSLTHLVTFAKAGEIRALLRTKDEYLAVLRTPVTLVNSGRLCLALARFLLDRYPERLAIFEGSPVERIRAGDGAVIEANARTVTAKAVVLCTNGYPAPGIAAASVPLVEGRIIQFQASMVAYESPVKEHPGALIYFHEEGDPREEPYFYLTRRSFAVNGKDLVAVGGPQVETQGDLEPGSERPAGVYHRIDEFMSRSYTGVLDRSIIRCWNGLMGYTPDGLRMVGPDPKVEGLWYNLGCNGVGLLPSLVAAKEVAAALASALDGGQPATPIA